MFSAASFAPPAFATIVKLDTDEVCAETRAVSLSRDKKSPTPTEHVLPILKQLAPVPAKEWKHLEPSFRLTTLARGESLTRAGEVAEQIGIVVSGLIRKVHVSARGRSIVRGFAGRGTIVGAYVSLLTRRPSYLAVEALEPTELFVLPWSDVEGLYDRHPCWERLGRRFAEAALLERESRAHELLTLSPTERFTQFCETHREILARLRSYDVASYLGITPVSLSRLRARARARRR